MDGEVLTSLLPCIELHFALIIIVSLLFVNMGKSSSRSGRGKEPMLSVVYVCITVMLLSDCMWTVVSTIGNNGTADAYLLNIIYFVSGGSAAVCWFVFCVKHVESKLNETVWPWIVIAIPYAAVMVLYLISPVSDIIFSIQDGEYVRGTLFFVDPAIKIGYIASASVIAIVSGYKRGKTYLRKKDLGYAGFGVPVLVGGVLQIVTGGDFICVGVVFGLILIYTNGITNRDSENTDAIYSLGNAFEASYIVNLDTGKMRPLRKDNMHAQDVPGMQSDDFDSHFSMVLAGILLPEDRMATLEAYDLKNVEKRLGIYKAYSVRYRIKEPTGQTSIHMASFIRAVGGDGRREFLIGINSLQSDTLLYEHNEKVSRENERLEQINQSIIESIAKIVEARDSGSGEHIVRVKKVTEVIAREVMANYPEFGLDETKVGMISSASVLHDVGKIAIPDAILLKPGRLTDEEFAVMKTHTAKGCDILNMFPLGLDDAFLEYALSICRWHHEKYDGRGYPDGLKGEEIPIAAQIVAAADCFDALTSERPYKKAFTPEAACDMISKGECGAFSIKILSAIDKQRSKLIELARLYR